MFISIYVVGTTLSLLLILFTKEKILMYPAWFPIDWKSSSKNFIIVITYQLIGLIVQAWQDVASDSYPPAYLIILSAHLRNLSYRVDRIGKDFNKFDEENYKELVNCIKDHKTILSLLQIIQEIISITCITQFICSGIVQCTVAVYVLYTINLTRIAIAIIFFFAVTFEMFVLCHFGNQLTIEFEILSTAILNCDWVYQSKKFRKDLLLFIQKSYQKNILMAGNYVPLTYSTFVTVLKSAYSVFTLLANLK